MNNRSPMAVMLEKRAERNRIGKKLAETKHIGKLQTAWLAATLAVTPLTALGIMSMATEPETNAEQNLRAETPENQKSTAAYLQKLDTIDRYIESGKKLEEQIGDIRANGTMNRIRVFSEYAQESARRADATVLSQALVDTALTPAQFKTIMDKASDSFEVNVRRSLNDVAATPKSETTLVSCQDYVLKGNKTEKPTQRDAKRIANCMVDTTKGGSPETRAFLSGVPLGMMGSFGLFLMGLAIVNRREKYLSDMWFVKMSDNIRGYPRPPELTDAEARANLDDWLKDDRAQIKKPKTPPKP